MDTLTRKEKIKNKINELKEKRKEINTYDIDKETKQFLFNQQDEFIMKYIYILNDIEIKEEKALLEMQNFASLF